MKNLTLYLVLIFCVTIIGCQKDHDPISNTYEGAQNGELLKQSGSIEYVTPSGDMSGVTDADNIQNALNAVKADGGTVHLDDGNYYVSRNIFIEGFWGTLEGESMDNTIIEAVRQSALVGFVPEESSYWPNWSSLYVLPTVLQFDYSAGDVIIKDLSIQATDGSPVDPYIHPWAGSNPTTAISTFIEILGGDHNTEIKNVRMKGDAGDAIGKNVLLGIHVMLGESPTPGDFGTGDLKFKNVIAEDIGLLGLTIMRFESSDIIVENATVNNMSEGIYLGSLNNSTVKMHDIASTNVNWPVEAIRIYNSTVEISNADIELPPEGAAGIYIWQIPMGLKIIDNTITGHAWLAGVFAGGIGNATIAENTIEDFILTQSHRSGITLWNSNNSNISGNNFIDISGGAAAIGLWSGSSENNLDQNNFVKSGLPGWTTTTPDGPGAVLLDEPTYDNEVFEMKFPPSRGVPLCEMVLDFTDNHGTPEYDGNNHIHHWMPCEKIPTNALKLSSETVELPMKRMQIDR